MPNKLPVNEPVNEPVVVAPLFNAYEAVKAYEALTEVSDPGA